MLPPSYWPIIPITPFDGDSRQWPSFINTFMATIHDTNIPDSYKMLSLKQSLTPDIRRRMAHIFNPPFNYSAALDEMKRKYGSPDRISQAHVQHLAAIPSFKNDDFKALFDMASMVREAVASVQDNKHLQEFTDSTIVNQLAAKLPPDLQREWGRVAYSMQPKTTSLIDFDKWIDSVVGAEEMRGARVAQPSSPAVKGGSSRPVLQGPTIMSTSEQHTNDGKKVLLAIVPVTIRANGKSIQTSAVLDPGSEATLIKTELARELRVKGNGLQITFGTFNEHVKMDSQLVRFTLSSRDEKSLFQVDKAFVIPNINLSPRKINWPEKKYLRANICDVDLQPIDSSHPPSAPHFGGVWERVVQSAKRALKIILQDQTVTDEVVSTVLSEVTSILNGRILTSVSADQQDPEPLTPNHFLLVRPHPHVPPDTEDSFHSISRRRWIQAQYLINQFWKRWVREYVPALMERQKWLTHTRDMQVGDEVLVVDNNLRRGEWLVGSVTRVYQRENDAVRFADVQTKSGNYTRPVAKLCFF